MMKRKHHKIVDLSTNSKGKSAKLIIYVIWIYLHVETTRGRDEPVNVIVSGKQVVLDNYGRN